MFLHKKFSFISLYFPLISLYLNRISLALYFPSRITLYVLECLWSSLCLLSISQLGSTLLEYKTFLIWKNKESVILQHQILRVKCTPTFGLKKIKNTTKSTTFCKFQLRMKENWGYVEMRSVITKLTNKTTLIQLELIIATYSEFQFRIQNISYFPWYFEVILNWNIQISIKNSILPMLRDIWEWQMTGAA